MERRRIYHRLILGWGLLSLSIQTTIAERMCLLPDILDPKSMSVDEEQVYIVDGHQIQIYALDDFSLIKKFGTIGEAPDAFRSFPGGTLHLHVEVRSEQIVVSSYEKISFFSKDGTFLSSMIPYPQTEFVVPLGKSYVASFNYIQIGTGKSSKHLLLYNEKMEFVQKITEGFLGSGRSKGFGGPDRMIHVDLVPDCYSFAVFEDRIYVGDSSRGYFFEVYDADGEKLFEIENKYEPVKVAESYRLKRMKEITELSFFKRHEDFVRIDEREQYPVFEDFTVTDGKLYVSTYHGDGATRNIRIHDLQGLLRTVVSVPRADVYTLHQNRYLYLVQNDVEQWELHSFDLEIGNDADDDKK